MSHRSASNVRLSKRVERGVREVRAHIAEIRVRQGHSETAVEGTKEANSGAPARTPRSDVPSTASPSSRSAGVPASRPTSGAPGPGYEPGARQRDARLGRWRNLGDFLTQCDRTLGIAKRGVMQIAELVPSDDPMLLLDYKGGLTALYLACESRVTGVPA